MKGFRTLLLIAVMVFVAYTYWQVTLLQKEVRQLEARAASRQSVTVVENRQASRLMRQAKDHCQRAQTYINRGQTRKAREELKLCVEELDKISRLSDDGQSGIPDLSEGWQEIRHKIDDMWKQFAQEAKPQKGR